ADLAERAAAADLRAEWRVVGGAAGHPPWLARVLPGDPRYRSADRGRAAGVRAGPVHPAGRGAGLRDACAGSNLTKPLGRRRGLTRRSTAEWQQHSALPAAVQDCAMRAPAAASPGYLAGARAR